MNLMKTISNTFPTRKTADSGKAVKLLNEKQRCFLLVEDDPGVSAALVYWLKNKRARSVLATSAGEALEILQDVAFIGGEFDALIADYHLSDTHSCGVIQTFMSALPGAPVATLTGASDIPELWFHERKIPIFQKPVCLKVLDNWYAAISKPPHKD